MSAEAADRVAVSGSRPSTPPQTSWFEFLLDEMLLENHLQKSHPGLLRERESSLNIGPDLIGITILVAVIELRHEGTQT